MNPEDPPATPASPMLSPADITCSRGLAGWLLAQRIGLAFTSYKSGQLYLVGVDAEERLAVHQVGTGRAMGLWADRQRLVLAGPFQVRARTGTGQRESRRGSAGFSSWLRGVGI